MLSTRWSGDPLAMLSIETNHAFFEGWSDPAFCVTVQLRNTHQLNGAVHANHICTIHFFSLLHSRQIIICSRLKKQKGRKDKKTRATWCKKGCMFAQTNSDNSKHSFITENSIAFFRSLFSILYFCSFYYVFC